MGMLIRFGVIALALWLWFSSMVHAARTERWGWFVAMLVVWPLFAVYLFKHYETPGRMRERETSEKLGGPAAQAREVEDLRGDRGAS